MIVSVVMVISTILKDGMYAGIAAFYAVCYFLPHTVQKVQRGKRPATEQLSHHQSVIMKYSVQMWVRQSDKIHRRQNRTKFISRCIDCRETKKSQQEDEPSPINQETSLPWVSEYVWNQDILEPNYPNLLTLDHCFCELSVYKASNMLFKSHLFSALGASIYLEKDTIVWIDYPLECIKLYAKKGKTQRA